MRHRARFALVATFLSLALFAGPEARSQARQEARLIVATQVLEELRSTPDQYIPDLLLERAYGIAVIPDVKKAAFGLGARMGRGVLVVRDKQGRFTNPIFLTLAGGSFGWQIGAQESDIVLIFTTRAGIEGIAGGKLTLGADASVAAGPVGRAASAGTDAGFTAEVYSYSRSRGLFAGLALDGSVLRIDRAANGDFYGQKGVATSEILAGNVQTGSESVKRFLAIVQKSTGPASEAQAPGAPPPPAPPAATAPSPDVKTFPMEDPQPGTEPPK